MLPTLGRRTIVYMASSFFRISLTLVTLPLMTKHLNAEDYGTFAIAVSVGAVFAILPQVGSSIAFVRGFHGATAEVRKDFVSSMMLLSTAIGITAAAVYVVFWVGIFRGIFDINVDLTYLALLCIGLSIVSAGWATAVSEALTLEGRANWFSGVTISRDLFGAIVSVVALYGFDAGVQALFIGHAASSLADIVAGFVVLWRHLAWRLSLQYVISILTDIKLTITQFIDVGGRAVERTIVSKALGLDVLGIVSHSLSYESIMMTVVKAMTRSTWPENLAEAKRPSSDFRISKAVTGVIALVCTMGAIVLATVGYNIIGLLTHNKFNAAAYFAAAWVANIAISTTGIAPKAAVYAAGRSSLLAGSMIVGRLLSIAALFFLIDWLQQTALIVAALLAALAIKAVVFWGISRTRAIPFQDTPVLVSLLICYLAIFASINFGDDFWMRLGLCLGWMLLALLINRNVVLNILEYVGIRGLRISSK